MVKTYYTLDNGGDAFKVTINNKNIEIFESYYDEENETLEYSKKPFKKYKNIDHSNNM